MSAVDMYPECQSQIKLRNSVPKVKVEQSDQNIFKHVT